MQHIIINDTQTSVQHTDAHNAAVLNDVVSGVHFNAFVDSQKIGPKPDGSYKKKGITAKGAATLREETEHILSNVSSTNYNYLKSW